MTKAEASEIKKMQEEMLNNIKKNSKSYVERLQESARKRKDQEHK